MDKTIKILLVMTCFAGMSACSFKPTNEKPVEAKQDAKPLAIHGSGVKTKLETPLSRTPMADILKLKELKGYPQKTIGEAFNSYSPAASREWREFQAKDGKRYYVDYICWFDDNTVSQSLKGEGVVKRGMNIKFTVQDNGDYYIAMASRLFKKTDGQVLSTIFEGGEINKILDAVYANKEISF